MHGRNHLLPVLMLIGTQKQQRAPTSDNTCESDSTLALFRCARGQRSGNSAGTQAKTQDKNDNMKRFAGIFGLAALLGGLFVLFRPSQPEPTPNPPATAPAADDSVPGIATAVMGPTAEAPKALEQAPAIEEFEFEIQSGKLISGPTVVKVHQGNRLRLRFRSNATDELHLHGYNLKARLRAGTEASLEFEASKTGRFGFELHHAKAELGAIEVYPR
jgi:hypothetical protein